MGLTSVIIPARNERYLPQMVDDIYLSTQDDIEVIVVLDGITDYPIIKSYPNLIIIENPIVEGVRPSLNKAVQASSGDYILKVDAHCIFGEDFIKTLKKDCEDDWVVVARRYTLDLEYMERHPRIVDYYYLSCPWTHPRGTLMMQSCPWITRTGERIDTLIDDLMCFQGSMWFTTRKHWDWLGGLTIGNETYAEHHEISMKTWLGGGRVVINKNTWYAHPAERVSGYHMSMSTVYQDHDHSARYWTTNQWSERSHDFDWLIDKFWPLPTEHNRHRVEKYYWPDNWRKHYDMAG